MKKRELPQKRARITIRVGRMRLYVGRQDYYALISSAFAATAIYLLLAGRTEGLWQLGIFLSGWGFGSLMEALLERRRS
ncbi:MAG: hypothetical protein RMJ14_01840 [Nitrososphaerota archaeon]|nr:hypothetical protein [Aigarchaeota archaeon]MDW8076365.1 hypothetical protein [Nitrososphaerota archaeon]